MDLDRLLGNAVERLTYQFLQPAQDWLEVHPFWHWLLFHPLWLLGLVVLILFLFAGLMGAIARLTEAMWLALLQAPIRLVQLLLVGITKLVKMPFMSEANTVALTSQQERLDRILNRLETLHHEQDELLQEMRSILATPELIDLAKVKIKN